MKYINPNVVPLGDLTSMTELVLRESHLMTIDDSRRMGDFSFIFTQCMRVIIKNADGFSTIFTVPFIQTIKRCEKILQPIRKSTDANDPLSDGFFQRPTAVLAKTK